MYSVYMYVATVIEYIHCTSHVHDLYIYSVDPPVATICRKRPPLLSDQFSKIPMKIFTTSHERPQPTLPRAKSWKFSFVCKLQARLPYSNEEKF